jgi:lipopolysaccharide transport system ATP-binding protein
MSEPIISVRGLGKKYLLGNAPRHDTLRDRLADTAARLFKRDNRPASSDTTEFWALKDVAFDVQPGEVVGIIGRNGAGKSTLLKLLSQITEPTTGEIRLRGRVASLLEVGTGFHPELTGRENVFLNGAILGMSQAEIRKKFDEIVDFADIEKFLDTPVKRYSSGMYVRLAFAVAAHLEPEILIVDEVLAVGDAQFQKKCLGKMSEVSKLGRTVLFVSHQIASIAALSSKCILLAGGQLKSIGATKEIIEAYHEEGGFDTSASFTGKKNEHGVWITRAALKNTLGETCTSFLTYEDIQLEIEWHNEQAKPVTVGLQLNNLKGVVVMTAYDTPQDWDGSKKAQFGTFVTRVTIPKNLLPSNQYTLHLALDSASPRVCYDVQFDALRFTVHDPMDEKCITRGAIKNPLDYMAILPALDWSSEKR